jgi:hypothetical protein
VGMGRQVRRVQRLVHARAVSAVREGVHD